MATMQAYRDADAPVVDLAFIGGKGLGLGSVVNALKKANQEFAMGSAVEVRDGNKTAGYLIYIPFSVQEYVDKFFAANKGDK